MGLAPIRVLLVEDVDMLRSVLRDYLADEGFVVGTASSCATGRQIAATNPIDVVVSDIRLPDGSGLTLCHEMKQSLPQIGIVLITGFAKEPIPGWVYEQKIPLLAKPLDLIGLADAIRRVAGRSEEADASCTR